MDDREEIFKREKLEFQRQVENAKLEFQAEIENRKLESQADSENIGYLNDFGHQAIKAILILNGGASIAFLTFIGSMAINDVQGSFSPQTLAPILVLFAIGAGLAVVSHAFNYLILASAIFIDTNYKGAIRVATILFAASAIGCFFKGVQLAHDLFTVL